MRDHCDGADPRSAQSIHRKLTRAGIRFARLGDVALNLGRYRDCETPLTRLGQARMLHRVARKIARSHGLEVSRRGRVPHSPCVLVANHLSYVDPIAIVALSPCTVIAKQEVLDWPLVGQAMREMGVLFVRRRDPHSGAVVLRQAIDSLRAGVSVLTFPEGTTTSGDTLLPFSRGIFGAAQLTGVPVVPLAIQLGRREDCWVGDALFLPHYLRTVARERTVIRVSVGAPFAASPGERPERLAQRAEHEVRRLLGLGGPQSPLRAVDDPAALSGDRPVRYSNDCEAA